MNESLLLRLFMAAGLWVLEATIVLLGAWFLVRRVHKNAARRHLIWLSAFCALLLVPILSPIVPPMVLFRTSAPLRIGSWLRSGSSPSSVASTSTQAGIRRGIPTIPPSTRRYGTPIRLGLLVAWLTGVVTTLLYAIFSLIRLRSLHARSTESVLATTYLSDLATRIGLKRPWEIRLSPRSQHSTAMTWGLFHPIVLLPREAELWPKERLDVVLLHELGHVRRGDYASQLLISLVCALYWFHPLVWQAARLARMDSETAADDLVLGAGVTPSSYATHLLWFATQSHSQTPALSVALLPRSPSKLETRIRHIVSPTSPNDRRLTPLRALPVFGLLSAIVLLFASIKPQVSISRSLREPIAALESTPLLIKSVRRSMRPLKSVLPRGVIRRLPLQLR